MTEAKTDRELLELAAKAAGIKLYEHRGSFYLHYVDDRDACSCWNPLQDDGDALRLAVKLNLLILPYPSDCAVLVVDSNIVSGVPDSIVHWGVPPDALASTRRAIVRAAAAIGEAMK